MKRRKCSAKVSELKNLELQRKFVIKSKEDEEEFIVHYSTDEDLNEYYTMYRSMNSCWTKPGEKILAVMDDGNGMQILFECTPMGTSTDYSTWGQLYLVMRIVNQIHPIFEGYISEEIKITEI